MKLAIGPFAIACAILWSGCVFLVALANLFWPPYAVEFLKLLSSVYPGYSAEPTFGGLLNVTLYAVVDGGCGGLLLAWLYNLMAARCPHRDQTS